LQQAKAEIASDGHMSEKIAEKIFFAFGLWDCLFALTCLNAGPPGAKAVGPRQKRLWTNTLSRSTSMSLPSLRIGWRRVFKGYALERENLAVDAEARRFSLPTADATDKLLLYEAHLDRQLYRAMDQLERLQRQRRGENVPPPLNVNLGRRT
jgi:hypothetical protein